MKKRKRDQYEKDSEVEKYETKKPVGRPAKKNIKFIFKHHCDHSIFINQYNNFFLDYGMNKIKPYDWRIFEM